MGNCCKTGDSREKVEEYNSDEEHGAFDPKARPNFTKAETTDHVHYSMQYNSNFTRVRKYGRWPTDLQCTILFFLYIIIMLAIAGYGFAYGYPEKLYLPTDYTGRTCGTVSSDFFLLKSLFFYLYF